MPLLRSSGTTAAKTRMRPLTRILLLILVGAMLLGSRSLQLRNGWCVAHSKLVDQVGVMSRSEACQINWALEAFEREMAADVRILVVPNTGGAPIERYSLDRAREMGLGQQTDRHGLLILYDVGGGRMRIEVGSRLEGVFTDAFVGYVIREHLRSFAATDRLAMGIRATMLMVFTRIRQAVLGEEYDPRTVQFIEDRRRLVVGGGTTAGIILADTIGAFRNREATPVERAYFAPQPTVEETYARYEDWLAIGATPSNAPLFTGASQEWLRDLPISNAFGDFLLLAEHGPHQIVQRGDLAMLYYTGTPFASPHYFRKVGGGWQMDIVAEVLNSTNLVGFPYTWSTRNSHDEYSVQFGDLWSLAGRAGRIAGGDNRPLPVHQQSWQEKIVSLYSKPWVNLPVRRPPVVDTVSVPMLTASIQQSQLPAVVVFYYTTTDFEKDYFPQLAQFAHDEDGKARFFVVSLDDPKDQHWIYWLFERHETPFPALWLHPWNAEEFAAAQVALGVSPAIARQCTCPRALLMDPAHALRLLDVHLTDVKVIQKALQQMH